MEFTGERFIPTEQGEIRLEHYHRYAAVLDIVSGKQVLDAACGEGYGSVLMSEVASAVIGVDISEEAVRHASKTYAYRKNLAFYQGSTVALQFADDSFDVVVSFETIEHLAEQAEMLSELRRVLRPKGVLIISSPNRPIYSEESGEINKFHVKELDFYEFNQLLKSQFPAVQFYGQRMMMGSVIQSLKGRQGFYQAWHDNGNGIKNESGELSEPVYFLALCAANKKFLPELKPSVLYPDKFDLIKHYVGFAKWAKSLDQIVAARDGQIVNLNQAMSDREVQIGSLHQTVTARDGQIAGLNQLANDQEKQIGGLHQEIIARDGQIASLNQAVSDQEVQISSLHQTVTARDGQITSLNQLANDQEKQIGGLHQEINARDGQIASLNQAVSDREAQIGSLHQEVTARDGQIASLSQAVSDGAVQISNLHQTVTTRDGQIATLNQAVSDRELQISSLHQTVTEREDQIASLNQAVSDQEMQISSLHQTVTARDGQIASLKREINDREAQLVSLHQAVTIRDEKITNLDQTLNKYESQITGLNQGLTALEGRISALNLTVIDRDEKIASLTDETVRRGEWALRLDAELKEVNAKLHTVTHSNSWRLTLPLREIRRWISRPRQQAKLYLNGGVRLTKRAYQSIPLGYKTKALHRRVLAKLFPELLLLSGSPSATVPTLAVPQAQSPQVIIEPHADVPETDVVIDLPVTTSPLVSVIIPIYGKIEYTMHCLSIIEKNPPGVPFEVIVVDDCSPDNSAEALKRVRGVRVIRNAENLGFIRSCNAGANLAKGEYLCFLNNDTEVTKDWLEELLRTFSEFPGTGLAGSKLVYPDRRLQEAGGIIWRDGSAWNFGRNQDPLLPVYNYAREVDYCSGASIMVPKSLFIELGGFDEHYLPAYCEDADLALKIRDKGYRVIYQPLSLVFHYEGITSGTDTTQGTKAYQVVNTAKLYERWSGRLKMHQPPGVDVDDAKDRRAKHRVLVLDLCTPTPDQDSGSIDAYNIMLLLREMDFQVTFIPEDNFLYMTPYTSDLQRAGIEVLYAPYCVSVEQHLKEFGKRYDLAFLLRQTVVDRNLKNIRRYCPRAKVLFHTIDLHFLRMMREAELNGDKRKKWAAEEMKQRELELIQAVDITTVVSSKELELLAQYLPQANIRLLPYSRQIEGTKKGFHDRRDIVFVGGFEHTPNIDAVKYFVSEVMPLLRKQLQGIRFHVVGSKMTEEIKKLTSEDVIIAGYVEDLNSLLDKMRVSVAPLRYGAGIKGKIGTAMAVGLPVVATSIATEGMPLTDGENILEADGAEAFALAVTRLYGDEALWNKISTAGLKFAEQAWGGEAAWNILASTLSDIGIHSKRGINQLSLYKGRSNAYNTRNNPPGLTGEEVKPVSSLEYSKKIQQELSIYEKQVDVHDLPRIYHYWSNKFLLPILQEAGVQSIEGFFADNLLQAKRRTGNSPARFVSIGSGNCDLEINIVKSLVNDGCDDFIFECVEINPVMLERGKILAKDNDLLAKMKFVEADFNSWRATKQYDGVMANQSLHHVVELEHLYDQIKKGLHDRGSFVISDIIGRNGHQRWPESLEVVNKFWNELPEHYKYNVLLNRLEKVYENWDCSKEGFEGIRSQDVLPLLVERFACEKFIGFGNAIDIFIDRCFGHNFNPDAQWDRDFIDRVHAEDEIRLKQRKLTPTHMVAVFVKKLFVPPYYSRGLDPLSSIRKP